MTTIKNGSPLTRYEQKVLKDWIGKILEETAYIILHSKEIIKLGEGKDDKPDTYKVRFFLKTYDGKLYKLVQFWNIDIMSNNFGFNLNFNMEIGRKYTKVELFDYDLFSKCK